ncbi:MAG: DUF1559 domain-containing protein, partial [Planctomycetota bacterium]
FLSSEHFACVTLNVDSIFKNRSLRQISWEDLDQQLEEFFGGWESPLSKIKMVHVVFDSNLVGGSPPIWILDLNCSINVAPQIVVNDSVAKPSEEKNTTTNSLTTVLLESDRLAIASSNQLLKLQGEVERCELQIQYQQLDFSQDISGLVLIQPIRGTLNSFFSVAAQFGGDEMKRLARIPNLMQSIRLQVSFEKKKTALVSIDIEDQEFAKEIGSKIKQSISNDQAGFPMQGMQSMGQLSQAGLRTNDNLMIQPSSTKSLEDLMAEIRNEDLLSVGVSKNRIDIELSRPKSLDKLVAASITDFNQQLKVQQRVVRLKRVAKALKNFYETNNDLPVAGTVDSSEDSDLKPQFNWRVGLLPYLGYQDLYDRFDFSKPWDDPANLEVASDVEKDFIFGDADSAGKTGIRLVGGDFGIYSNLKVSPKLEEISDRKIWTALAIDTQDSKHRFWTEPEVIVFNEDADFEIQYPNENGVLLIDSTFKVRAIRKNPDKIRAVLTTSGGEVISRKDFIPLEGPAARR